MKRLLDIEKEEEQQQQIDSDDSEDYDEKNISKIKQSIIRF